MTPNLLIFNYTIYTLSLPIHIYSNTFGDKTSAKNLAIKAKVSIINGSDDAFSTPSEAEAWIESADINYPVIVKVQ